MAVLPVTPPKGGDPGLSGSGADLLVSNLTFLQKEQNRNLEVGTEFCCFLATSFMAALLALPGTG